MRSEVSRLHYDRCGIQKLWVELQVVHQSLVLQPELNHHASWLLPRCGYTVDRTTRICVKRSWLENAEDVQWLWDLEYGGSKNKRRPLAKSSQRLTKYS